MTAPDSLPPELRELVKSSVALLGRVIEKETGGQLYSIIENTRQAMATLRDQDSDTKLKELRSVLKKFRALSVKDREQVGRAYTLMLEVMNACENAHRSHRLAQKAREESKQPLAKRVATTEGLRAIFYVLTAHPTEARSPHNIAVFRAIHHALLRRLWGEEPAPRLERELFHLFELAWRVPIVRDRAPKVRDEAEHVYSTLLEPETLESLLEAAEEIVPVYVRSWVGGDKDGHPGVDEVVMRESLGLSRVHLLHFFELRLDSVRAALALLPHPALRKELTAVEKSLTPLRDLRDGDAARVEVLRKRLASLTKRYEKELGAAHPALRRLRQLLHVFPGLVVPLELRESSDVLLSKSPRGGLAIERMLRSLAKLARGGDPRWYARGFIVSMASELAHVQAADAKVRAAFGSSRLPIIPLFEQQAALERSPEIARAILRDPRLGRAARQSWGHLEMMVGYSDSAKESGVLASRWGIASAMHRLDAVCATEGVRPLFFQGSGGSVDRGGGSVREQTEWWPHSALSYYKVTIQGEMVERSLASPEITRGQIERISESVRDTLSRQPAAPHSAAVADFSRRTAAAYRASIADPAFLRVVEFATPYARLSELKIGSRPTSRQKQLSVGGLRAIPWVLCWTQTRSLLPTWWGIGRAWKESSAQARAGLREAFVQEPVFRSYVKALGFTVAKIELAVFELYLEQSSLNGAERETFRRHLRQELAAATEFLADVSGEASPLWFRPWLAASIRLRSPMIHPLNLLQILALESDDPHLLRLSVTGISSGMLTTG